MTPSKYRRALAAARAMLIMGAACVCACAPAVSQAPPSAAEVEQAHLQAPALRMSFNVKFQPLHALGGAQALEGAGRHDEAAGIVVATLRDEIAFHGLCFERLSLGGAELVISVCAPLSLEASFVTQRFWLEHLGARLGIIFVERNLVAYHDDAVKASPL